MLPFFVAACGENATLAPPTGEPDPLVPLTTFLAPQSYDAPQISPDGTKIAYLGPVDGVSNFFVAPIDDPAAARPITRETGQGIRARDVSGVVMYRWTADSRYLLYPQDNQGDESWNLFRVDAQTGEKANLTQLEGARMELLGVGRSDHPGRVLVSISASMVEPADLFRIDVDTGERSLVEKNPGFLAYMIDNDLRPRIAMELNAEGGIDVLARADDGHWQHRFTVGQDDFPALSATGNQKIARFDAANRRAFFYDSRGRNTIALVAYSLESDTIEVIAEDARVDIGGVLYHPTESVPQAYATNWTRSRWNVLDETIRADLELLGAATEGEFRVVSRSADDRRWIVRFTLAHEPETYSLYERQGQALTELFVTTPQLSGLRLSKMYAEVIESRDGLDLVSYLSYPPWIEVNDGRPSEPVPLVMLVHGGPGDERAQYAYGPFLHWLTNRGYGVVYVNFRGSPGFGKEFVNAARMEWGGKMHDDLVDQVEWAIAEGITTRDKVAILGGSYGGYAVLVGMTMTPDVFACGIDMVGPSNLEIFMPHWDVDLMSRTLGDPRTEEGRQHLRSRSPINFAHQAKHPILIAQGANDSRVPQAQSDSMVKVFEENDVEVTYVLYPDEGHGLARTENNFSFWAIGEVFLGRCLGGRYQELTDELEGSSAQVLVGAEHIPGLLEALARRDARRLRRPSGASNRQ